MEPEDVNQKVKLLLLHPLQLQRQLPLHILGVAFQEKKKSITEYVIIASQPEYLQVLNQVVVIKYLLLLFQLKYHNQLSPSVDKELTVQPEIGIVTVSLFLEDMACVIVLKPKHQQQSQPKNQQTLQSQPQPLFQL